MTFRIELFYHDTQYYKHIINEQLYDCRRSCRCLFHSWFHGAIVILACAYINVAIILAPMEILCLCFEVWNCCCASALKELLRRKAVEEVHRRKLGGGWQALCSYDRGDIAMEITESASSMFRSKSAIFWRKSACDHEDEK